MANLSAPRTQATENVFNELCRPMSEMNLRIDTTSIIDIDPKFKFNKKQLNVKQWYMENFPGLPKIAFEILERSNLYNLQLKEYKNEIKRLKKNGKFRPSNYDDIQHAKLFMSIEQHNNLPPLSNGVLSESVSDT